MQAASPYEKTNLRASFDFLSWLSHLKASKKARVAAYLCFFYFLTFNRISCYLNI
ncbi:conserved hypothetical protein [Streptococcus equi subsp. zooepidemicus ATCC 35246]|nr:conserved hypothetical protein [Streptococcus equi subsp. zooepidemicus ATCC 35246]AIA68660.1 hypothetical protein Q426_02745 [Streptococcus equi subsp. zooepidemicus CY]